MYNKPIENKVVTIFSWPEPKFSGKQYPYLSNPYKMAWLSGD